MNRSTIKAFLSTRFLFSLLILILIAGVIFGKSLAADNGFTGGFSGAPQDVIRLESRLTRLEQRQSTIEINMQRLEQQIVRSSGPGRNEVRDPETTLLDSQMRALQQRLAEVECELTKIDERTLPAAVRQARRQSSTGADPCRQNVDSPVRLSARP